MNGDTRNHTCLLYSKKYEIQIVQKLLKPYLDNRIPTIIICDHPFQEIIENCFGEKVQNYIKFVETKEVYGEALKMDQEFAIQNLRRITKKYSKSDYFLIIGKMTKQKHDTVTHLIDYEIKASKILEASNCAAVCLYELDQLEYGVQEQLIDAHPFIMINGKLMENVNYSRRIDELVTICMHCKKVKESEIWTNNYGSLLPLENVTFSHGICDDCFVSNNYETTD